MGVSCTVMFSLVSYPLLFKLMHLVNTIQFVYQVEVKRTVPREDMQVKGAPKTKKIFVGGLPVSLTEGITKEEFLLIMI